MRRTAAALIGGAILILAPVPAAHAQYPPERPICIVDASRAAPGDELTLTGDRWRPSSTVDLDFEQDAPPVSRDLGAAAANSAGTFVETVVVPAAAHGGPARLRLTGLDQAGDPATCTVALTITGADDGACAQVSDDEVLRGQRVQVFSADGCWERGTEVSLTFFSTPVALGTARVRADGSFSRTVTIPASAAIGPHTIRVRGTDPSGALAVRSIPLEVVGGNGGGLSGTGLGLAGLLALAVGLFASGGSMVLAARRVPVGADVHPVYRHQRERALQRAQWALVGGALVLAGWLLAASIAPGHPAGLSWRHPVSVGTVLAGLSGAFVVWLAANGRRR